MLTKHCYRQAGKPIGDITPIGPGDHPSFIVLQGDDFTYANETINNVGTYTNTSLVGFQSVTINAGPLNRPLTSSEFSANPATGVFKIFLETIYTETDTFVIFFNW